MPRQGGNAGECARLLLASCHGQGTDRSWLGSSVWCCMRRASGGWRGAQRGSRRCGREWRGGERLRALHPALHWAGLSGSPAARHMRGWFCSRSRERRATLRLRGGRALLQYRVGCMRLRLPARPRKYLFHWHADGTPWESGVCELLLIPAALSALAGVGKPWPSSWQTRGACLRRCPLESRTTAETRFVESTLRPSPQCRHGIWMPRSVPDPAHRAWRAM